MRRCQIKSCQCSANSCLDMIQGGNIGLGLKMKGAGNYSTEKRDGGQEGSKEIKDGMATARLCTELV